jgi:hypothetical protein
VTPLPFAAPIAAIRRGGGAEHRFR